MLQAFAVRCAVVSLQQENGDHHGRDSRGDNLDGDHLALDKRLAINKSAGSACQRFEIGRGRISPSQRARPGQEGI
jgi:hypothetical protein